MAGRLKVAEKRGMGLLREIRGRIEPSSIWRCIDERGGDIDKLGRGCVWRDEITPCLHQNHVFAVRPHSVDSDWLALWISTLEAKRYFESRAKRSTNLASISGSNIKELPVPLPPIGERLAIQQFLAGKHLRLECVRSQLRDSLRLLAERRAALITAAVTGQIPLERMRA